ncbi:hypothetical protein LZG75_03520 [Polynucleobacter sp. IMCC30063]|uniref:sporadic carbohydrate cluster 2OG-Fe(II) oxygenase n=1 Tax=Polynucleobacter sp. IMCC30063 TaxID=2907298 RepID=UPI001F2C798D|nr:sporadic carbohydrate cluster 2OG-Fe(II) oxygenase [Polynucleobacter sp. IMCC30063]MCE7505300.1 hypothetical protein [Polynucleobacter sp. IMCC30063]
MNKDFLINGFEIIDCPKVELISQLRDEIYKIISQVYSIKDPLSESGLNYFHKHIQALNLAELNKFRLETISCINSQLNVSHLVFNAFRDVVIELLGPDILVQKNCNLVLQPPGDPNPSEIHRDAPLNSPYEIVVWIPLVDCYKTKSMYILDAKHSTKAIEYLDNNPEDWDAFEIFSKSLAVNPDVKFGQALIFHTGCIHGSEINKEMETRVSLNIRFKNLFSPPGMKNQLEFFDVINTSQVVRLGNSLEFYELTK